VSGWAEPLFPDRPLTPAEREMFYRLAARQSIRERELARRTLRYWTDPAYRAARLAANRRSAR